MQYFCCCHVSSVILHNYSVQLMIRLFMEARTEELLNLQHLNVLLSNCVYTKSWVVVVVFSADV